MFGKKNALHFSVSVVLALITGVTLGFAGSAVIGTVANGKNATVGGQALQPNSMLFSGDTLRVSDGAAEVAMDMGSLVLFGRDTVASFERVREEVTVLLGQGNVSLFHPQGGVALRVQVGDVSVVAGKGFKTVGDVAMVNGALVVTAKEGMLRVESAKRSVQLTKGKTIAIVPKAAGSPQPPQTAVGGVSTLSSGQWIGVASLGAVGAGATVAVVNGSRTNDAKTLANQVNQNLQTADQSAIAATNAASAASNAAAAAQAAANKAQQAACNANPASRSTPGCA